MGLTIKREEGNTPYLEMWRHLNTDGHGTDEEKFKVVSHILGKEVSDLKGLTVGEMSKVSMFLVTFNANTEG